MIDPKKGKYTEEEIEYIISALEEGVKQGKREREILKEVAFKLNRGYTGVMSYVRKLKAENPEKFAFLEQYKSDFNSRLNSWDPDEEQLVIDTVNQYLDEGKSISDAIDYLEKRLSRTSGAIYQRIYTLRKKFPKKFKHLPPERPRRRKKFQHWQLHRPMIRQLDDQLQSQSYESLISSAHPVLWNTTNDSALQSEEEMIFKAFEERYGRLNPESKEKLMQLMRQFGCTRVSIALLTLQEDKAFPSVITDFLAQRLQNLHF
jgi:hypothetical protein